MTSRTSGTARKSRGARSRRGKLRTVSTIRGSWRKCGSRSPTPRRSRRSHNRNRSRNRQEDCDFWKAEASSAFSRPSTADGNACSPTPVEVQIKQPRKAGEERHATLRLHEPRRPAGAVVGRRGRPHRVSKKVRQFVAERASAPASPTRSTRASRRYARDRGWNCPAGRAAPEVWGRRGEKIRPIAAEDGFRQGVGLMGVYPYGYDWRSRQDILTRVAISKNADGAR